MHCTLSSQDLSIVQKWLKVTWLIWKSIIQEDHLGSFLCYIMFQERLVLPQSMTAYFTNLTERPLITLLKMLQSNEEICMICFSKKSHYSQILKIMREFSCLMRLFKRSSKKMIISSEKVKQDMNFTFL